MHTHNTHTHHKFVLTTTDDDITSFGHICGSVTWPWNLSIINCGLLEQTWSFVYYSYTHAELGNFGWHHTPGTVRLKHCSSKEPSQEILSITVVLLSIVSTSLNIPTLFITLLRFEPARFIIPTGVDIFLFSKFVLLKVRCWRPVSDAKYNIAWEHDHATK